jgi:hypothetical protein
LFKLFQAIHDDLGQCTLGEIAGANMPPMCDGGHRPASPKVERISGSIVSRQMRGDWPLFGEKM